MEYIELEVVKVVLIRVIKRKKLINIILKSEMTQLFWDIFFFANGSVIVGRREYYFIILLINIILKSEMARKMIFSKIKNCASYFT